MSSRHPKPQWKVTLDGRDLTATLVPRLNSLTVTSDRQDTADQLDIVINDHDGRLALPPHDAVLRVWLGWEGEGKTDMGSFTVDELEHAGTPDVLTLRARSAHLRSQQRQQREQSWHATTLGAIVDALAGRNSLTPRCHPSLASVAIEHIDQTNESDLNFLTRLGKRYDAVATIKAGALILAPIGAGTTATGATLPSVTLTRASGDQHRYHAADRQAYSGIRAQYDDKSTGKTETVLVGTDDGKGVKTLRTTYSSKANALRAARSEYQRLQRGTVSFDITLARGRADLLPETHVALRGWKPEIDATDWTIVRAEHTLGEQGFTTRLSLEWRSPNSAPESDVDDAA
jgi:uncharacterized protein